MNRAPKPSFRGNAEAEAVSDAVAAIRMAWLTRLVHIWARCRMRWLCKHAGAAAIGRIRFAAKDRVCAAWQGFNGALSIGRMGFPKAAA